MSGSRFQKNLGMICTSPNSSHTEASLVSQLFQPLLSFTQTERCSLGAIHSMTILERGELRSGVPISLSLDYK